MKPTKRRKKVKRAVVALDTFAKFTSEIGRKEAARRLKVSPSTIGRWLRTGLPEARMYSVKVAMHRRAWMLGHNARRRVRAEYEAASAGMARSKPKLATLNPTDDAIQNLQWEWLKTTIPQMRDVAEEAWASGDFEKHREWADRITPLRESYKTIRVIRLKKLTKYPELWDATEDNIDEIAEKLAKEHDLPVKFFYRMWSTP